MCSFNVFAVELDGSRSKVGPESGFVNEADAHGYALTLAAGLWNNHRLYLIISHGDLVAAYPGAGLNCVESVAEECETDADELDRAA